MTRACLGASLVALLAACNPPPPTEGGAGGSGGAVAATGGAGGSVNATGGSGGRGSDLASGGSSGSSASGGSSGGGSSGSGGTANTGGSSAAGTGGTNAGTGGTNGGTGGSAGTDASASDTGAPDAPAVTCAKANLDGFTSWLATNEGKMIPSSGSILVRDGAGWVGNVEFVGAEWHVLEILVGNTFNTQRDFSMSKGFTLTYAATTDIYIQARPANAYSGGAKHVIKLPSTNGAKTTTFFSFAPDAWTTIGELGRPNYPLGDALKQLRAFVVVGKTPNKISFYGLTVDGYRPTCP
jgi:hypothetical protein